MAAIDTAKVEMISKVTEAGNLEAISSNMPPTAYLIYKLREGVTVNFKHQIEEIATFRVVQHKVNSLLFKIKTVKSVKGIVPSNANHFTGT